MVLRLSRLLKPAKLGKTLFGLLYCEALLCTCHAMARGPPECWCASALRQEEIVASIGKHRGMCICTQAKAAKHQQNNRNTISSLQKNPHSNRERCSRKKGRREFWSWSSEVRYRVQVWFEWDCYCRKWGTQEVHICCWGQPRLPSGQHWCFMPPTEDAAWPHHTWKIPNGPWNWRITCHACIHKQGETQLFLVLPVSPASTERSFSQPC